MELIKIIYFISLFITNVFSYKINTLKYVKNFNEDELLQLKICEESIEKNCDIDLNIKKSNLDKRCEILNSHDCEILRYGGISSLPECQTLSEEHSSLLNTSFLIKYNTISLMCIKDENNQYCPYSLTQLVDSEVENDEDYIQAIQSNCNSTYCTENTIIHVNDLLTYYNDLEILNYTQNVEWSDEGLIKIKEILNSSNCTTMHHSIYNDDLSSSANKTYKRFLYILNSLLLLYFYNILY